jgi:drug/metabolite transporter (DMT)-like permease
MGFAGRTDEECLDAGRAQIDAQEHPPLAHDPTISGPEPPLITLRITTRRAPPTIDTIDMVRPILRPERDRDRLLGVSLVLAAACLYGSGPFFARVAYDAGMAPLPLLTWRYVFAACLGWLLVVASASGRSSLRALGRRDVMVLLALGVLFVGNAGAYTAALETVPAGLVAIITYVYPALVAVIAIRFVRRLEGRRAWIALAVSMAGVALAVGGIPRDADIPLTGLVLAFLCPVFYAVWIVLAARLRGERPEHEQPMEPIAATGPDDSSASIERPDALSSSAIMSTVTALTAASLVVLLGGDPAPSAVPVDAWVALVGFGAFSALAIVAFLVGTRRIGAARAALVSTIEPVYTIVMATILLGESLSPLQVLGGALVVLGVLLAESGRVDRPGRVEAPLADVPPADPERARV